MENTREAFLEAFTKLEAKQSALQGEFVNLKKTQADKSKIDDVQSRLKEGKSELAELVSLNSHLVLFLFSQNPESTAKSVQKAFPQ